MTRTAVRYVRFLLTAALLTCVTTAQLQPGDVLLTGVSTAVHIRGATSTPFTAPVGTSLSTTATSRQIEHLPGSSFALLSTPQAPLGAVVGFSIYLLDFSGSLTNPTSALIVNGPSKQVRDLDADVVSGDVYVLFGNGDVMRLAAPIGVGSTLQPFATGQTSALAIAALPAGNVLITSATSTWYAAAGATAPGPDRLVGGPTNRNGLAVSPVSGDIFLSAGTAAAGSVTRWSFSGLLQNPVMDTPEITGTGEAKFEPTTGLVFGVAVGGAVIGGVPFGVQTNNDNVVVANAPSGPSASTIAFGPATGHGVGVSSVRIAVFRTPIVGYPIAVALPHGSGCTGSASNTPGLAGIGTPTLGNAGFGIAITGALPSAGVAVFLSSAIAPPTPIGAGCSIWVDVPSLVGFITAGLNPILSGTADPAGSLAFPVPIPPDPGFAGLAPAIQAVTIDGGTPLGLTLTNALALVLGV